MPPVLVTSAAFFFLQADQIPNTQHQLDKIPQVLHFATKDGNYRDNGGAFTITFSQLDSASTPEPASYVSAGIGLPVLIRRVRAKSRR